MNMAEHYLQYGLEIRYSHQDEAIASSIFRRALEMAVARWDSLPYPMDESFVCRSPEDELVYHARPGFLRATAVLEALVGGRLDREKLLLASSDYEQCVVTLMRYENEWLDDYDACEAMYLAAARTALVVGAPERARQLLTTGFQFSINAEESQLLSQLAAFALNGESPPGSFFDRFDEYFDYIRDPEVRPAGYMETGAARLDYGVLRDRYFFARGRPISWQRVIDMISQ